jgi:hypothetical protein
VERDRAVRWERLPEYFAAVLDDAVELFDPGERQLAYVLGWLVHVVSDSLIKSQHSGIDLHLLDGKYTPRNRPIQDLVTYHEIGVKELQLDWPALFSNLVATPVEPIQLHYMRIAPPRGRLARLFPDSWEPGRHHLLLAVLAEDRRWCRNHADDVVRECALQSGADGTLDCSESVRRTVGMDYAQMCRLAEQANFRRALWQMGEAIADMMEATLQRSSHLARLPGSLGSGWEAWAPAAPRPRN